MLLSQLGRGPDGCADGVAARDAGLALLALVRPSGLAHMQMAQCLNRLGCPSLFLHLVSEGGRGTDARSTCVDGS